MTQSKDSIALALACMGPVGRFPKAPGTAGSAVAAILAPWIFIPLPIWARVVVLGIIFMIGAQAADRAEKILGRKDPGCVIIDELVGQWVAFLLLPTPSPWMLLAGFILFRLFDIIKPFPIRQSETWLPGGYGIMIDDVIGGVYALACLQIVVLIAAR